MNILTVGAIVRSFASLIMSDSMSARAKQGSVLLMAVFIFDGYTATHTGISLAGMFDSTLEGLTAGLTALGVYHLSTSTDTPVIEEKTQQNG